MRQNFNSILGNPASSALRMQRESSNHRPPGLPPLLLSGCLGLQLGIHLFGITLFGFGFRVWDSPFRHHFPPSRAWRGASGCPGETFALPPPGLPPSWPPRDQIWGLRAPKTLGSGFWVSCLGVGIVLRSLRIKFGTCVGHLGSGLGVWGSTVLLIAVELDVHCKNAQVDGDKLISGESQETTGTEA
jgi:hypothetical protein